MTFFCWNKCKKTRRICALILICVLIGMASTSRIESILAKEQLNMYSGSYALIDGDSGRILAGKEENVPMANASTTKILTCIVALENCKLDEVATVSANAASQPKVRLGMSEGEQYPLKDMLYGLMLESYNDCAVVIAEHVAGSVEAFAKIMNEKAAEIGCADTYFITPNGLDAEDDKSFHHTTASDLCRLMAYCTWESSMKEEFLKITQTRNYTGSANGRNYSFINHNAFLNQMDGILTGKTGFTNKAGYCYVAAMEVNGEQYCIALLACGWPNNKTYKWKDARTLFEYGMENYDLKQVTVKELEEQIKVEGYIEQASFQTLNKSGNLAVYAQNREYQLLMNDEDKIETEIIIYTDNSLPIQKAQTMGECNVYLDGLLIDSFPLIAKENVYIWGWKDVLYTIFYQFLTFSL